VTNIRSGLQHYSKCNAWVNDEKKGKQESKAEILKKRKDAIIVKLKELGHDVDTLPPDFWERYVPVRSATIG